MIAYLSLTKNSLPDVAARALAVAERFNTDVSLGNEVQRARRDCWDSLKSIGAMFDFESRDSRSIRAALCTLETDRTTADVSELAEWFLTFADGVEDHSSELWDLAKTAFS
jgi:hypothetical protein